MLLTGSTPSLNPLVLVRIPKDAKMPQGGPRAPQGGAKSLSVCPSPLSRADSGLELLTGVRQCLGPASQVALW